MKEEYIQTIMHRLSDCNDFELLEIILQLLQKSR